MSLVISPLIGHQVKEQRLNRKAFPYVAFWDFAAAAYLLACHYLSSNTPSYLSRRYVLQMLRLLPLHQRFFLKPLLVDEREQMYLLCRAITFGRHFGLPLALCLYGSHMLHASSLASVIHWVECRANQNGHGTIWFKERCNFMKILFIYLRCACPENGKYTDDFWVSTTAEAKAGVCYYLLIMLLQRLDPQHSGQITNR